MVRRQQDALVEKDGKGGKQATAKPSHSQGRRKSLRKGLFSKSMWMPAEPSTITHNTITKIATTSNSTTDDDEMPSFYHSLSSGSSHDAVPLQGQNPTTNLQRRRSHRPVQHASLAVVQTSADLALDDDWDYSETEWWGWVILLSTWLVFVVGMGSCFGVWSWAWDVGETPYAPPELEDDPTLPITGYYPALIVCTVVMAWIWVVVAWVGMKYFKHSKLTGDDG